jgi:hypothetical protein
MERGQIERTKSLNVNHPIMLNHQHQIHNQPPLVSLQSTIYYRRRQGGILKKIPENVMKGCTLGGMADKLSQAITLYEVRTYVKRGGPLLT